MDKGEGKKPIFRPMNFNFGFIGFLSFVNCEHCREIQNKIWIVIKFVDFSTLSDIQYARSTKKQVYSD